MQYLMAGYHQKTASQVSCFWSKGENPSERDAVMCVYYAEGQCSTAVCNGAAVFGKGVCFYVCMCICLCVHVCVFVCLSVHV